MTAVPNPRTATVREALGGIDLAAVLCDALTEYVGEEKMRAIAPIGADALLDALTDVVAVRDLSTGRIEHEVFGSTPFADVPPSPYYRPLPGFWLNSRAWLDADGQHVTIAHDCTDSREVHLLPWPTWQVVDGSVSPSFSCDKCGVHSVVPITAVLTEGAGQ